MQYTVVTYTQNADSWERIEQGFKLVEDAINAVAIACAKMKQDRDVLYVQFKQNSMTAFTIDHTESELSFNPYVNLLDGDTNGI